LLDSFPRIVEATPAEAAATTTTTTTVSQERSDPLSIAAPRDPTDAPPRSRDAVGGEQAPSTDTTTTRLQTYFISPLVSLGSYLYDFIFAWLFSSNT
jgi:hypothetical protein